MRCSILGVCAEKGPLNSEDLRGLSSNPESVLLSVSFPESFSGLHNAESSIFIFIFLYFIHVPCGSQAKHGIRREMVDSQLKLDPQYFRTEERLANGGLHKNERMDSSFVSLLKLIE